MSHPSVPPPEGLHSGGPAEAPRAPRHRSPEAPMDLSDLVGTLRAPGTPDELAHAETTVAAMAAAHAEAAAGVVPLARVDRRRAALAAGATVGIVAVVLCAGTAAAAFSGALPAGLQNAAHDLLGAPSYVAPPVASSESSGEQGSGDPVGPGVSTDAASLAGLCTAFAGVASDDPQADSVAYRALASAAAAAAESVEDYCGEVLAAGGKPSVVPGSTQKPTAKPTPTKKSTVAPGSTVKPTAKPTQKPTAKPSSTRKAGASTAGKPSGAGSR